MADINLKIGGSEDVSKAARSAGESLGKLGTEAAAAGQKAKTGAEGFSGLGSAVKALGGAFAASKVLDFFKQSVAAFAEQSRADALLSSSLKQLGHDSASLTPILKDQASAFQSAFGVSDDMVQQMQSLMVRFGVAPTDIKKTTVAILDYAAATGEDAVSATEKVVRGINGQDKALKSMGVTVDKTKSLSEKLDEVVGQMSARFGGSAKAAAETLGGQIAIMGQQFGELQETAGGFVAALESRLGVVSAWTELFRQMGEAIGTDKASQISRLKGDIEDMADAVFRAQAQVARMRTENASFRAIESASAQLAVLEAKHAALTAKLRASQQAAAPAYGPVNKPPGFLSVGGGDSGDEAPKAKEVEDGLQDHIDRIHKAQSDGADKLKRQIERQNKETADAEADFWRESERGFGDFLASRSDANQQAGEQLAEDLKAQRERIQAEESQWAAVGVGIGSALVGGVFSQLRKMKDGGEFDVGELILSVAQVALTAGVTAALAAGTGGAGVAAAPLASAAISGVFSMLHTGGWAGENGPTRRFHTGGEVPALLQSGERVLSRSEVAQMGGQRAVDRAVGQRGGNTYVISALDSQSFVEFMGGRGGRGLGRVVDEGRGEVAQLLRKARFA